MARKNKETIIGVIKDAVNYYKKFPTINKFKPIYPHKTVHHDELKTILTEMKLFEDREDIKNIFNSTVINLLDGLNRKYRRETLYDAFQNASLTTAQQIVKLENIQTNNETKTNLKRLKKSIFNTAASAFRTIVKEQSKPKKFPYKSISQRKIIDPRNQSSTLEQTI